MSDAFRCDLCDTLEAGKPAQRLQIAPSNGSSTTLEACALCLVSFNEWRVKRAPVDEQPRGFA